MSKELREKVIGKQKLAEIISNTEVYTWWSSGYPHKEYLKDVSVDELITLIRNATQDEAKPIESALKALVELKDYKDEFGKTAYYIQRQPIVWNDARRAIDNLRGAE